MDLKLSLDETRSCWKFTCFTYLLYLGNVPSIVAISFVKEEIHIFQIVKWPQVDHVIEVSFGFMGGIFSL